MGFGDDDFGDVPFGDDLSPSEVVPIVVAVRENVVRVTMPFAVYLSGVWDAQDCSLPSLWSIDVVPGTSGLDQLPTRPVAVVTVGLAANGDPSSIDLTLDRPMSPWPSQYEVSGLYVWDTTRSIEQTIDNLLFFGVQKLLGTPSNDFPNAPRDLANPQTLSGALDPLPDPLSPYLGTYRVDETGDYAFDTGIEGLKKRIVRRLVTVPGAFLHLGNGYGIGIQTYGKKLASAATRGRIISIIQTQIAKEPEVVACKAQIVSTASANLFRVNLLVRTKTGQSFPMAVPVPVSAVAST